MRVTTATHDPITVVVDHRLSASTRERLDSLIETQWRLLAVSPTIPVTIAMVIDDDPSPMGLPRPRRPNGGIPIDVFLPNASTNGRCIALAHVSIAVGRTAAAPSPIARNLSTPETIGALLSPCALFAAFGEPGPRIRDWLRDGRWQSARFAAWGSIPTPWTDVVQSRALFRGRRPLTLVERTDPTWQVRDYVAPEGVACLANEVGACSRAALETPRLTSDTAWRDSVVSTSGTNNYSFFIPTGAPELGPANGSLVSEMVRTLGPQKFERFWRSSLPVDSAFDAASGEPLDDWVRQWGQRMYGAAAVGPGVTIGGVSTGTILVIASVWASIMIERRRRVA
jgi:hypothetical protein